MVDLMDLVVRAGGCRRQRGNAVGLSPYQILIIASMIEREAKVDEDRPKIARVIFNRLSARHAAADRRDAAVRAAGWARRSPTSCTIDTPYNTYMHAGLPPTPIANPGRASIQAAVEPGTGPVAG